ncbi:MAG: two-component regulator propeller domain-containing protein [Bacteroidota bacterium]
MTKYCVYNPIYFLLLVFTYCTAQNVSSDKHTLTSKGNNVSQTHDSILVVHQDSKHNLWFGSNGFGVYRYDGKIMLQFTTKDGLCDNHIWKIQEDKAGNIYFTTISGISKYDGTSFKTLRITKNDHINNGWKLHPDDLWFQGAQDSGVVYRYDGRSLHRLEFPKTKVAEEFITQYPRSQFPNMKFNPYDVYSIFKDSKGNMWFGTGMLGVCRYDGKSFTWIPNNKIGMDKIAFCVRSIIEDKDGKLWFSNTKHRYAVYMNDSLKAEKEIGFSKDQYDEDYTYFMSGFKDTNGDLWMATFSAGVWHYNGKTIKNYPIKNGDTNVTLFSIYKDRLGTLWLGTHTAGVYKFNGKAFEKFKP